MPLHPDSEKLLQIVETWPEGPDLTVEQSREGDRRRQRELGGQPPPVADVRDVRIGTVPARVYEPLEVTSGVLVWLHGGGWVVGSVDGCDEQARALANASGCVVLSVDYRLAPEHPFPAGLMDCYAAVEWAAEHLVELGPAVPVLAVGGDSAGGNLSAAVTLLARERGGPRIDAQLLVYPVTGYAPGTRSYEEFAEGYWLTPEGMDWCWRHYLPEGEDGSDPLASPLHAHALEGLPPAVVATAEYDVLRDEGERYAERLRLAGVPVQLKRYEGLLHGFLACAGVVEPAWAAFDELGRALAATLAGAVEHVAEPS
jgi:acetyl esterase/lipase